LKILELKKAASNGRMYRFGGRGTGRAAQLAETRGLKPDRGWSYLGHGRHYPID
jgi:hypothetical protein